MGLIPPVFNVWFIFLSTALLSPPLTSYTLPCLFLRISLCPCCSQLLWRKITRVLLESVHQFWVKLCSEGRGGAKLSKRGSGVQLPKHQDWGSLAPQPRPTMTIRGKVPSQSFVLFAGFFVVVVVFFSPQESYHSSAVEAIKLLGTEFLLWI